MRRPGILSALERTMSNSAFAMLCFLMLLWSLHPTMPQAILAVFVWVQATTEPPAWLIAERENNVSTKGAGSAEQASPSNQ